MRAGMMLLVFVFTLGVVAMSQTAAVADEPKKEEKKFDPANKSDPTNRDSYDEQVTVRQWNENKKEFRKPVNNLPAYRAEFKGQNVFYMLNKVEFGYPLKGSEITDADGNVYVVEDILKNMPWSRAIVKPKPKDK